MSVHKRLKLARETKFDSAAKAARALKVPYGTYSGHESGSRGIKKEDIARYAKFFGVSPGWLAYGEGADTESVADSYAPHKDGEVLELHAIALAPVRGVVQAGVWTEFEDFEDKSFEGVEIPIVPGKWASLQQFAFKVRGSSMDADRIHDGDFVVCVPYFDARPDITSGDTVVVERRRNSAVERTVKIVEIDDGKVRFCPRSSDDRFRPIEVSISRDMREADDTEVVLIGLVIFVCQPR